MLFKSKIILVTMLSVSTLSSCSKDKEDKVVDQPKNIVEVASADTRFSLLVDAVTKAGLGTTLSGTGPYTVFAPTNDAFKALFDQLGVNGISDLDAGTLRTILLNHALSGKINSSAITTGYVATLNKTAPGNNAVKLFVNKGSDVKVDGSKVIVADVIASNGVIHAVDKVILPAGIIGHAMNNPNFSILVEAVVKAGLVDALSADGPFTVFAPTNDAFKALFTSLGVSGIADLTAEQLTPILLYHVLSGNIVSSQVTNGSFPTLKEGSNLNIEVGNMGVILNSSVKVISTDVQASNGVIHAIDAVLLP